MNTHYYHHDYRPSSPLSPAPKSPSLRRSPRYHRSSNNTSHNTTRQRSDQQRPLNLQLPPMPRFHPANFITSSTASNAGSQIPTQTSGAELFTTSTQSNPSPNIPTSSHSNYHYSLANAQQQLYHNHRELASLNCLTRTPSFRLSPRLPGSPLLNPLGSPGPVTPLELEKEDERDDKFASYFSGALERESDSSAAVRQEHFSSAVQNRSEPIEKQDDGRTSMQERSRR